MNSWIVAVILGIVEGLTEFLPVSSTGHLIVVGSLLGFVGERAASFEVVIQLGAILSLVLLYWRRFVRLMPVRRRPLIGTGSTLDGWSGLGTSGLAPPPPCLVGYLARQAIKERLFNPEAVTLAIAAGGIAILLAERYGSHRSTNTLATLTLGQAVGVGFFQVLSLWPG